MKKRVVLFDFHNTLVTCDAWLELEIRTLAREVLRKLDEDGQLQPRSGDFERADKLFRTLRLQVHESGREVSAVEGAMSVLRDLGYDVAEPEVGRAVAELEQALLPQVEMVQGADRTLTLLRDAGYRLGVVSSAGYPLFVELALEELGLRAYFSAIVTTTGERLYKSNPEIYGRAAHLLDASPQEAVHVGDHVRFDVQSARAAGLSAIWVVAQARRTAELRREAWDDDLSRAGADAVVESLDEVFGAVQSLG